MLAVRNANNWSATITAGYTARLTGWLATPQCLYRETNTHNLVTFGWTPCYAESVCLDFHSAHTQSSSTWLHINDESFNSIPFVHERELVWE